MQEQIAIARRLVVTPSDDRVEIDLDGVVLREAKGALETLGSGIIRGQVERRCATLQTSPMRQGQNALDLQEVLDPDWSSAFCAPSLPAD